MDLSTLPSPAIFLLSLLLLFHLCSSLNDEGRALLRVKEMVEVDPYGSLAGWVDRGEENDCCSWFGVGCEDGRVVSLNLADLCLKGKLSAEIGKLIHLRYLILHNNSFYGVIPKEIKELQKLETLDLEYNNFEAPFPSDISQHLTSANVLLNHDELLGALPGEHSGVGTISRRQAKENKNPKSDDKGNSDGQNDQKKETSAPTPQPAATPSPSPSPLTPPSVHSNPPPPENTSSSPPSRTPSPPETHPKKINVLVASTSSAAAVFLVIVIIFVLVARRLRSREQPKALATGLQIFQRTELARACEDFSNVIGSLVGCAMYKGILSNGAEIAVASATAESVTAWPKHSETLFKKKVTALSKLKHKHFVNLLGYCMEDKPIFARMMVFEYTPNGTLYDRLHDEEIKAVEDLDWRDRLKIAMGIAFFLEDMLKLEPPIIFKNLNSRSIYLTDRYEAKIADFELRGETITSDIGSGIMEASVDFTKDRRIIVFKYGLLLLEIISGELPYDEKSGQLANWASGYVRENKPAAGIMDVGLKSCPVQDVIAICELAKSCLAADPNQIPKMKDVVARIKQIVNPHGTMPKVLPLWSDLETASSTNSR